MLAMQGVSLPIVLIFLDVPNGNLSQKELWQAVKKIAPKATKKIQKSGTKKIGTQRPGMKKIGTQRPGTKRAGGTKRIGGKFRWRRG